MSMTISGISLTTLRPCGAGQPSVEEFGEGGTVLAFAHQDDDLLWMLPFFPVAERFLLSAYPSAPLFEQVVDDYPSQLGYRERWLPIWGSVDDDIWAGLFTDACAREPIVTLESMKQHLRPHLGPSVRRVISHNNWGEYGHHEHRLLNRAVRELAVEKGIDVWAMAIRIDWFRQEQGWRVAYVDVADQLDLPTIEGYFDATLFRQIREAYLSRPTQASTAELTARFRAWSPTAWTWLSRPDDFPAGWRPYVKLVDRGMDLTPASPAVIRLERSVGVTQVCRRSTELSTRALLGLLRRRLLGPRTTR
jgi:hypothetical protein